MKTKETLLANLLETVQIDNLDLQYFIENSDATSYGELEEYICENNGFDVEIIYFSDAIDFLKEYDQSLSESLDIAKGLGLDIGDLTSEVLASLLASENCRNDFWESRNEIEEYYTSISELEN